MIIVYITINITGIATKNTIDILIFILNTIIRAISIIIGLLATIIIIIIYAICTFLISDVSLVTRLPLENLSIFLNENFCIFLKISLLKFLLRPFAATDAYLAPVAPKKSDIIAIINNIIPIFII